MKKLDYIFMAIAAVSSILSIIACVYMGKSWIWQLSTLLWVCVAFISHNTIERQEKTIEKLKSK
jgi:hypothetical protein